LGNDSGATAIEYAMVAAGVAMAVITVIGTIGQSVKDLFFDKIVAAF